MKGKMNRRSRQREGCLEGLQTKSMKPLSPGNIFKNKVYDENEQRA